MESFPSSERTSITRLPKRGTYDKQTVFAILDEALFCTIAFCQDGYPVQIPTGFCRIDETIFIHGSVGSHWMRTLASQQPEVSVSVTLMDGLVLARSAFHHSVNYRAVSVYSRPEVVSELNKLDQILEVFTEKVCPGRWNDIRKPTANEWKETLVLALPISEAVAKIRTGPPKDDKEDYDGTWWAGVVPFTLKREIPIPDPELKQEISLPDYLKG
jgi:nitroimidazol reductase NimA-like FMN-containing flavoprotein (pyridoxamine 5'-phosphate oxidase superfamily)